MFAVAKRQDTVDVTTYSGAGLYVYDGKVNLLFSDHPDNTEITWGEEK